MMHHIPQQEERHDRAERPRPDTWEQQAAEQRGFPTFKANFDDTEGRRR